MRVSVTNDTAQLAEFVRRAKLDALFESIRLEARAHPAPPGPSAARSADFLYDDDGLPA